MLVTDTIHRISPTRVEQLARAYHKHIPAALEQLEQDRLVTIPQKLRTPASAPPLLARQDLIRLMEWKLKRGKFRPTLMKLVESNDEATVAEVTKRGFDAFMGARSEKSAESVLAALKTLTELKGVGPATASLLLAVCDGEWAPFFSDELFAWAMTRTDRKGGEIRVWEGKMAYSVKEYGVLWDAVQKLRERFAKLGRLVPALDVEHAAWMIVKGFAGDVEAEADVAKGTAEEGEDNDGDKAASETDSEEADKPPTKKRKAPEKDSATTTKTKKTKKKR